MVRQFLFKDFTVLKVLLTVIIVGGIGMVLYGYFPGTAVAAIGAGSVHALVGAFGMILGGILYALSFDWVSQTILPVWAMGKVQLLQLFGVGAPVIFAAQQNNYQFLVDFGTGTPPCRQMKRHHWAQAKGCRRANCCSRR